MNWIKFLPGGLFLLLLHSCANRAAGPTGGPKDTIPPVVIRSIPENGTINYQKKTIAVYFDENITLDKVNENFIMSPPQQTQPVIRANARVLTVTLEDELIDSTTYSLFFGNAIVDLNEKNPLPNFQFAFSTGNEIDTLQVSGLLYDAFTLNPVHNVFVGLHASLKDSAIYTDKFARVTKTDIDGQFTVRNIKEGTYSIYALQDANRDFMYQPGEAVAFYHSTVEPNVVVTERSDTLWADSLTIDTIHIRRSVTYYPDNITMKLFKEDKKRQFLLRSERPDPRSFSVYFNRHQDSLAILKPLNFDAQSKLLLQANATMDSLTWWITDSMVYAMDTLLVSINYQMTDSLFRWVPQTDTLSLTRRRQTAVGAATQTPVLKLTSNISPSFDLNNIIRFRFEQPIAIADTSKLQLLHKQDTLMIPVNFKFSKEDEIGMNFSLNHAWIPGDSYELVIDSAAFVSIYSIANLPVKNAFRMKKPDDYSTLKIVLEPFDSLAMIQVINDKETVIQQQRAKPTGNLFSYLKPGDYFLKLYVDANANGKWDTGDLELRIFPEEVFYFSIKLSLKANWELEESWDFRAADNPFEKPLELMPKKR
jgi:uncharacterized protein (DUF2141 family)